MAVKKSVAERAVRVNITFPPSVLDGLDKNVEKLQAFLIRHGAEAKDVAQVVNRSSLLQELARGMSTEFGYQSIKAGFALKLGLEDNGQTSLFPEEDY